jgi:glycosyltransferase involved in cell wall biosynthesis
MGETDRGAESGQLLETTIRALHQTFDYQLVVGFYAVPTGFTAVFTARFLDLPSVLCLRGNDVDRALYHGGQLDALTWALRNATAVVGVSRELTRKASILSGRSDLRFIPNSVDCDMFSPRDDIPVEPRSLLFSGEMRLKKGSEILFPTLSSLRGDWSMTIVGGFRGAAESEYRKWAVRERRAAQRVRLLPYARDARMLSELYNRADLVLNPALWDGMPNSVLEAMACARPVLSTRVGGIADLVEDGVTGYLLDLAQLGQLGETIERILDDPHRASIGRAARDQVRTHHHGQVEALAFQELFRSLMAPSSETTSEI